MDGLLFLDIKIKHVGTSYAQILVIRCTQWRSSGGPVTCMFIVAHGNPGWASGDPWGHGPGPLGTHGPGDPWAKDPGLWGPGALGTRGLWGPGAHGDPEGPEIPECSNGNIRYRYVCLWKNICVLI